jgi:hypothetical protein
MSSTETIAFLSLGVSVLSLVIAGVSAFLNYRFSSKSKVPSINHYLTNLPPYLSKEEKTEIKIRNEGTAQALIRCIFLEFSWDKDWVVHLYDDQDEKEENNELFISPNETIKYYKNLPEPPENSREHVTVTTIYDNDMEKEECFELGIRTIPRKPKVG